MKIDKIGFDLNFSAKTIDISSLANITDVEQILHIVDSSSNTALFVKGYKDLSVITSFSSGIITLNQLPSNITANVTGDITVIVSELETELTGFAYDSGASGAKGLWSMMVSRLSTLITKVPTSLGKKTNANSFSVTLASDEDHSTATNQNTTNTRIGSPTETVPSNDTDSSGLNGRLQRIAQRLSTIIDIFPISIGQKSSAQSLSVVLADDQNAITTINSSIVEQATNYDLVAVNDFVKAKIVSSARYVFSISTPLVTANTVSLASCTTTINSNVIAFTGTAPVVGRLIAGTGIVSGAYVTSVNPGVSFTISINATANGTVTLVTTGGDFQVNFESSEDDVTYIPMNVSQKTLQQNSGTVQIANTIGLFVFTGPSNANFVRARVSAINSIPRIRVFLDSYATNKSIRIPFISGLTTAIPTGIAFIPPIDCDDIQNFQIDVQLLTGTSQSIAHTTSNDPNVAVNGALNHVSTTTVPWTSASTITASGQFKVVPQGNYYIARLTHTAITAMNIGGVIARLGLIAQTDSSLVQATGPVADGSTSSGNGIRIVSIAKTGQPTARTDNQIVAWFLDKIGRLVTVSNQIRDLKDTNAMVTISTTTETTIVTAIASTFNDIEMIYLANTSALATRVDIRETTAGSVRYSVPLAGGEKYALMLTPSIAKQAIANTNWTAQLSVAVTDVRITPHSVRNI